MAENNENAKINKIPPHDNDAEIALLGSMLFDEEGLRIAVEKIKGEDFFNPAHEAIYNAIKDLYDANKPVEFVTVQNRLNEMGVLDKIGGREYIINLISSVSTSAHINHYLKIVLNNSVLRRVIAVTDEVSALSYSVPESVDSVISMAEEEIAKISQNRQSEDFLHIKDVLHNTIDNIEKASKSDSHITGIETGFTDFDRKTSGLQNSDLILIAARPSMGKTAFALNIAQYVAVRGKVPTAIFSLEMSAEQLANRLACSEALIDAQNVRTGKLTNDEWMKLIHGLGVLSDSPIYIDDTPGITPTELRAKCRKLKLDKGLGLIVIDYLQLMDSGKTKEDSVQQQVAYISKSLKAIARELNVPIIALSQLSRSCESRNDKRPMLSDLRDSGAIEQDADVVCFLYRDEYYNKEKSEKKNQAEVIIAKQRNGPTGTVDLAWLGQYTKFANLAPEYMSSEAEAEAENDAIF